MINLNIEEKDKAVIICITGELSLSSIGDFKEFENAFNKHINSKFDVIALDLKNVLYIDSYGMSRIIKISRAFNNSSTDFVLVNINDNIDQIFKETTFGSFFNIMTGEKFIDTYCREDS